MKGKYLKRRNRVQDESRVDGRHHITANLQNLRGYEYNN